MPVTAVTAPFLIGRWPLQEQRVRMIEGDTALWFDDAPSDQGEQFFCSLKRLV